MRVGAVLVQAPDGGIPPADGDVPDDGHPHVRVGLQAEGQDGGADEEHGDHANYLKYFICILIEKFSILY